MKKILLVISLISVLFLAGCNKDKKIEEGKLQANNSNQQYEQSNSSNFLDEQNNAEYKIAYLDYLKLNKPNYEFSIDGYSWGWVNEDNIPELILSISAVNEVQGGYVVLNYSNGIIDSRNNDEAKESDHYYVFNDDETKIISTTYEKLLNILNSERILPFIDILEKIYSEHILPDGTELYNLDNDEQLAENEFAIIDIDFDGREELIFSYNSGAMADVRDFIFDYDKNTQKVILEAEFNPSPITTYYDDGIVYEKGKHNQGNEEQWPYTLYKYNTTLDRYEMIESAEISGKELNIPFQVFTKDNIDLLK